MPQTRPRAAPTSRRPSPGTRTALSDNQLLAALAAGDVVLVYGGAAPPPGLRALARAMAPAFTPALAASGQAVILARRAGTGGIVALAWTHRLRATSPDDPSLRGFIQFWLGRGAPRRGGPLPGR